MTTTPPQNITAASAAKRKSALIVFLLKRGERAEKVGMQFPYAFGVVNNDLVFGPQTQERKRLCQMRISARIEDASHHRETPFNDEPFGKLTDPNLQ